MAMPRTIERVVCTLWLTIETLVPTSRLTSVDLPALGAPMMRDEAAAGSRLDRRSVGIAAFHTPSRTSSAVAAVLLGLAAGAARRRAPASSVSTVTSTSKRGAWSGPLSPTIA